MYLFSLNEMRSRALVALLLVIAFLLVFAPNGFSAESMFKFSLFVALIGLVDTLSSVFDAKQPTVNCFPLPRAWSIPLLGDLLTVRTLQLLSLVLFQVFIC